MSKLMLDEEEAKNWFLHALLLPASPIISLSLSRCSSNSSDRQLSLNKMSPKYSISSNVDLNTCCGHSQQYYSLHNTHTTRNTMSRVFVIFLLMAVLVGVRAAPRITEQMTKVTDLDMATKHNDVASERKLALLEKIETDLALNNKHRKVPRNPMTNCNNNLPAILEMICPNVRKDILMRLSALGKIILSSSLNDCF